MHAETVEVAAATSLQDALKAVARAYATRSKDKITFNFAGSNVLARQIRAGAPVDIFFSADEATMNTVADLLSPGTRRDLLSNRLLILGDLKRARRIAIGNPNAVPAGVYAREYLQRIGLWREVEPRIVPAENVRAALAAFDGGNVDAAIVYVTDVPKRRGTVVEGRDAPDIRYPIAILRDARHPAAARRFFDYLRSDEALKIFKRFGFGTKVSS